MDFLDNSIRIFTREFRYKGLGEKSVVELGT